MKKENITLYLHIICILINEKRLNFAAQNKQITHI